MSSLESIFGSLTARAIQWRSFNQESCTRLMMPVYPHPTTEIKPRKKSLLESPASTPPPAGPTGSPLRWPHRARDYPLSTEKTGSFVPGSWTGSPLPKRAVRSSSSTSDKYPPFWHSRCPVAFLTKNRFSRSRLLFSLFASNYEASSDLLALKTSSRLMGL